MAIRWADCKVEKSSFDSSSSRGFLDFVAMRRKSTEAKERSCKYQKPKSVACFRFVKAVSLERVYTAGS